MLARTTRSSALVGAMWLCGLASCGSDSATEGADGIGAAWVQSKVVLVPLRSFPEDLLVAVEDALEAELGVEVERHAVMELPESAYYAPRKRYRAERLLDALEPIAEEAGAGVKVLGLTEVDISTTGTDTPDWGIFGLGRHSQGVAVISSKRLRRNAKSREHVRFRVSSVAVHEIGHTFGLPHCQEFEVECVMLDAEGGIENTDTSSGKLGPECRAEFERLRRPWPLRWF